MKIRCNKHRVRICLNPGILEDRQVELRSLFFFFKFPTTVFCRVSPVVVAGRSRLVEFKSRINFDE